MPAHHAPQLVQLSSSYPLPYLHSSPFKAGAVRAHGSTLSSSKRGSSGDSHMRPAPCSPATSCSPPPRPLPAEGAGGVPACCRSNSAMAAWPCRPPISATPISATPQGGGGEGGWEARPPRHAPGGVAAAAARGGEETGFGAGRGGDVRECSSAGRKGRSHGLGCGRPVEIEGGVPSGWSLTSSVWGRSACLPSWGGAGAGSW